MTKKLKTHNEKTQVQQLNLKHNKKTKYRMKKIQNNEKTQNAEFKLIIQVHDQS